MRTVSHAAWGTMAGSEGESERGDCRRWSTGLAPSESFWSFPFATFGDLVDEVDLVAYGG